MNREEAYKLLGGYATNSLTEEERRILFEAALDDQELFNALGDEQALKELLDDPFSREQLRRAAKQAPRRSWLRRPWVWATASVVAVSALTIVAIRQQQPPLSSQPQAQVSTMARLEKPVEVLAPSQPAPEKEIRTEPSKAAIRHREAAAVAPVREQRAPAVPAASPVQAAPAQETAVAQVAQAQQAPPPPAPAEQQQLRADSLRQAAAASNGAYAPKSAPAPAVAAFRDSEKAPGTGGLAGLADMKKDLTTYLLSRRGGSGAFLPVALQTVFRAGDIVRITVIPASAGRLSVETRADATAEWKRIFPPSGEAIDVAAGRPFSVPVDLEVAPDLRVRLIVAPAGGGPPVVTGVALRVAP